MFMIIWWIEISILVTETFFQLTSESPTCLLANCSWDVMQVLFTVAFSLSLSHEAVTGEAPGQLHSLSNLSLWRSSKLQELSDVSWWPPSLVSFLHAHSQFLRTAYFRQIYSCAILIHFLMSDSAVLQGLFSHFEKLRSRDGYKKTSITFLWHFLFDIKGYFLLNSVKKGTLKLLWFSVTKFENIQRWWILFISTVYLCIYLACMFVYFSYSFSKRHSRSSRAEPVPVPGPAQLPGPFGPVWDRLHRGLGLYSLSLLQSLSTHRCLISSVGWDSGQETERGRVLNTNRPPRKNSVTSVDSQSFLELLCA